MIKYNNISPHILYALKVSNELTNVRLSGGKVNKINYEVYKHLKDHKKLNLPTVLQKNLENS